MSDPTPDCIGFLNWLDECGDVCPVCLEADCPMGDPKGCFAA